MLEGKEEIRTTHGIEGERTVMAVNGYKMGKVGKRKRGGAAEINHLNDMMKLGAFMLIKVIFREKSYNLMEKNFSLNLRHHSSCK